jgi:uncharacterized protein YjiS (DUF1127 family)
MHYRPSCTATFIFLHRTIDVYIPFVIPARAGRKDKKKMLISIIRFLHAWKRYGTAIQELSYLTDRELADIGISRGDIPRVAWEHAQA